LAFSQRASDESGDGGSGGDPKSVFVEVRGSKYEAANDAGWVSSGVLRVVPL
jgi:hypothetical protein